MYHHHLQCLVTDKRIEPPGLYNMMAKLILQDMSAGTAYQNLAVAPPSIATILRVIPPLILST